MNQEDLKLAKIKKSCKAAGTWCKVIAIISAVGAVISGISGIVLLVMRQTIEPMMIEDMNNGGKFTISQSIGPMNFILMQADMRKLPMDALHSSIPGVQNLINQTPYSVTMALILLSVFVCAGVVAFALFELYSMFHQIEKDSTPFSETVLKKLRVSLIVICVVTGIAVGVGFGLMLGVITWAILSIMEYGMYLQTQSDETL